MKRIILIMSAVIALAGCKTDLIINADTSKLNSDDPINTTANLNVEVASCQDYEDSRLESKSLIEAKSEINRIIPKSEYKECYKKKFDSFAIFKIPVIIGGVKKGQQYDEGTFYVGAQPENKSQLFLIVPKEIKSKLKSSKNELSSVGGNDLNITINLKNDTDSNFDFKPYAVFIDDNPYPYSYNQYYSLNKGAMMKIKLSDVSVAYALSDNQLGVRILDTAN